MSITATELKLNLSKYLLLSATEDIYITKNGKIVSKLTNPFQERVDVANARADIYELQWMRIGILKEMGNRASLAEALKDYCTVIGYNQEKAKTMLDSLESE